MSLSLQRTTISKVEIIPERTGIAFRLRGRIFGTRSCLIRDQDTVETCVAFRRLETANGWSVRGAWIP